MNKFCTAKEIVNGKNQIPCSLCMPCDTSAYISWRLFNPCSVQALLYGKLRKWRTEVAVLEYGARYCFWVLVSTDKLVTYPESLLSDVTLSLLWKLGKICCRFEFVTITMWTHTLLSVCHRRQSCYIIVWACLYNSSVHVLKEVKQLVVNETFYNALYAMQPCPVLFSEVAL